MELGSRSLSRKDALHLKKYKPARDTELEAKLYLAMRAEHAKAKQERRAQQKKHLQAE